MRVVQGLLVGAIAAVAATLTHLGPVDLPYVGLALAATIVFTGAWFAKELGGLPAGLAYLGIYIVVSFVMVFQPLHNDVIILADNPYTVVWLYGGPIFALLPLLFRRGKKTAVTTDTLETELVASSDLVAKVEEGQGELETSQ